MPRRGEFDYHRLQARTQTPTEDHQPVTRSTADPAARIDIPAVCNRTRVLEVQEQPVKGLLLD